MNFLLIEFYAPWCGHCKALEPEYEKAATALKGVSHLAKIDADKYRKTAESFEIQGFPTLKLFKNGKFFKDYTEGRKAENIIQWMKKKTGPVAKLLSSQQEIDEFVKENYGQALVGYYNNELEAKRFFDAYTSDKVFEDFAAGYTVESNLVQPLGTGSILLFRSFAAPIEYEDKDTKTPELEGFKEFVVANGYPLVEEISSKNYQRFFDAGYPLAILFYDSAKKEENDKIFKLYEEVASKFKGKFSFTTSDGVEYREQLDAMGGKDLQLPAIAAMNIEKRHNFPYSGQLTVQAISEYVEGILSGKTKPFFKSDEVPQTNDGPVYVVVGKTFDSVVMDNTKDVLVEFYAPWCGHCKELEPKYNNLGQFLAPHKNSILIAKIDATTNDTPTQIEGFPTILFFPKDGKDKPIAFDGQRNEKKFLIF